MVALEDGDDSCLDGFWKEQNPPFTRKEYDNYWKFYKKNKRDKKKRTTLE